MSLCSVGCLLSDWAATTDRLLGLTIRRPHEDPVKCLTQEHNKQACRLDLHTIPIVLSAKQGSCEYHFLKSFGMTRVGEMNPRSTDCSVIAPVTKF